MNKWWAAIVAVLTVTAVAFALPGTADGTDGASASASDSPGSSDSPDPTPPTPTTPSPPPTTTHTPSPVPTFAHVYGPVVTGSPVVGQVLTAVVAAWTPSATFTYQWLRSGVPIPAATGRSYRLVPADRGRGVAVRVTGGRPGYVSVVRTSTAKVVVAPFTTVPLPTITGIRRAGSTLTAWPHVWVPAPSAQRWQWRRDGLPIPGATARWYTLRNLDTGHRISVTVTSSRSGFATTSITAHYTSLIGKRPVIVLDPGHAPANHRIDPLTGLDVSEYANHPEMEDVWDVALRVRKALQHDGYTVIFTKPTLTTKVNLADRARVANRAHADLALSIHDQAGASGGIRYRSGNNIVYYQSVGGYRRNVAGRKIVFTNTAVAARSKAYAAIFRSVRASTERATVRAQGSVGYDLGGRGLAGGNMWMVQLLSSVPWIYNEAGGNSPGHVGLVTADRANYALALARSVERSVPLSRAG